MSILITGAAGFLGQELAAALLAADPTTKLVLTDVVEPTAPSSSSSSSSSTSTSTSTTSNITLIKADLLSPTSLSSLLSTPFSACYLLHGIMSGGSETDLDAGLRINFDATRSILDHLRVTQPGVKIIFTSSLAVYGPPEEGTGQVNSEKTVPLPQGSYGAEKLMVEVLLNDYSRRGVLDGRVVRLPTVIVRPGRPAAAASSFASGIVREPLNGEKSVLPVRQDIEMWICSPRTVVRNLVFAKDIAKEKFGLSRTVNLPGRTVTVREILEALEAVGGREKRELVVERRDPAVERLVESWPARFDTTRARELGFVEDGELRETVEAFAESLKKR